MKTLLNFAWRAYALAAALVLIGTAYGFATHQPKRGLSCTQPVSVVDYSVYAAFRAVLWPYPLFRDVVQGGVAAQDWITLRYDALGDACTWAKQPAPAEQALLEPADAP